MSPTLRRSRLPNATSSPRDASPPLLCEGLEGRRLLASAGTLLSYDFNAGTPWASLAAVSSSGVVATASQSNVGTVDAEGTSTKTGAVALSVTSGRSGAWTSDLASGLLAVSNAETNLGKLTLGFSLSASQAVSVKVIVTSYDAGGNRSGALATTVLPAAVDSFQRYSVDLSTMAASGSGTFAPAAPFVSFNFEMGGALGWTTATSTQLRVDNVQYSKPAYYVSPIDGNDKDNGTTEALAFATIQKALDVAQPGDLILLKGDTAHPYTVSAGNRNYVRTGGTPAAWVTLKNYPGQSPLISTEGWAAIQIGASVASTAPAIAYVEVRGLHVKGDSLKVGTRSAPDGAYDPSAANADQYGPYAKYIQPVDPTTGKALTSPAGTSADSRTNGNGLSVDGGNEANEPHDIRFADNLVEQCAGGGIGAGDSDRIQIENNVVRDNCYWDKYATSGISILSTYQFEATTTASSGTVGRLIRNNVSSGNLHKEKWVRDDPTLTQYSDGNGVIVDINTGYAFRTLVTNNLAYDNGGSGIHAFKANHVDIVDNTSYLNSSSPYLQYGMIFANNATDVRIYNNIMVAPVANTAAGEKAEYVTGGTTPTSSNGILYKNNVYFGGNVGGFGANAYNVNNVTADPRFVLPSTNPGVADFHLQSTSPAINKGIATLAPQLDLAGVLRDSVPDSGAYEFVPSAPTGVTLAAASDTGTVGDNRTNLNNASTAKLTFVVAGTVPGTTVNVYAGQALIGTAVAAAGTTSTSVLTNGTAPLADGTYAVTATQNFPAGVISPASPATNVVVDTSRPALVGVPAINLGTPQAASRSQVRTITFTFSEPVAASTSSFALADRDGGAVIDLSSRSVAVSGSVVTLTLDAPGVDASPQLFLPDGNYALTLSPTIADAAGNALDPAAGTATFNFFKLLGDFNGGRSVTATDYSIWRAAFGQPVGGADGVDVAFDLNASGSVTATDYSIWRARFGDALAPRDDDGLAYAPPAVTLAASLTSAPAARVTLAKTTTPAKTTTTTTTKTTTTKTTTTRSSR